MDGDCVIREAFIDDCAGLARAIVGTWREAYDGIIAREYLERLSYGERQGHLENVFATAQEQNFAFVAVDGTGGIIGYAGAGLETEGSFRFHGEIYAPDVLKEHQGNGAGGRPVGAPWPGGLRR